MKFLVIRTDRIGDLIVSTPVFKALKEAYPSSHITAMVNPYTRDLLKNNPNVDEIIVYDESGVHSDIKGFLNLLGEIREKKFDVAITLFSRFKLGLLLFLSRIPTRIAPATKLAQIFYNHRVLQRRSRSVKHEADYNLDLLSPLGIEEKDKTVGLWTDSESDAKSSEYLEREGLAEARRDNRLIGIHPGSGDSAKNWKPERYAELADRLILDNGYSVILTGSRGEKELLSQVADQMKSKPSIYMSSNICEFAALVKNMTILISSSTGPMHMAAALRVPTVSLFCPVRVCSPVRWGPVGNRQRVLLPDVPQCEKCTGDRCEYYECMDKISVESVADSVMELAGGN